MREDTRLLAAVPSLLRSMIIRTLDTCMRQGEMLALQFGDKTGETREKRKTRAMLPLRPSEVALRERASGAGFQISLEASGGFPVRELDHHEDAPGSMPHGLSRRTGVVPFEAILDITCASRVVSEWIALAAKDVHKPGSNTEHGGSISILRASNNITNCRANLELETEVRGCCVLTITNCSDLVRRRGR